MRELPDVRLDSIVSLVTDKASGHKDPTKPYLGLEHLPSSGSAVLGMSSAEESISINNKFRAGDILFGKLRPRLRKSVRVAFDGYCSTDILVLRATAETEPPFAGFVLRSDAVFSEAIRTEEGTKMPRCSWDTLRKLRVFSPDQGSQRRIAEILTTVDEAIEQTEALIAKMQQVKAGLMHDLFTRGVTPDGKLRPPREEVPHLYKESPLGWIPKEWDTFVLATSGVSIVDGDRGEHYPQAHELLASGECLFLSATNVTPRGFQFIERQFITREKDRKLRTGKLVRGDVVITTRGTVGNIAYFDWSVPFTDIRINSGMVILRSTHPGLSTEFLYAALQNHVFDQEYKRVVSGSAQPQLPIKDLRTFRMLMPSPMEQEAIVQRLRGINASLTIQEEEQAKLRHIKSGLMADLLTGRVRVPIAESQ